MTPIGNPDLTVSFAGIELKNPIIAASGTFGYGIEFEDIVHLDRLGGFVVKGLSKESMTGNPPPRLFETAAGMLNAIGLQNVGAPAFLAEKLPALREKKNVVVFANVFGWHMRLTCHVRTRRTAAFSSAAIRICSMKWCGRRSEWRRGQSSSNSRPTSHRSPRWRMLPRKLAPTPSPW